MIFLNNITTDSNSKLFIIRTTLQQSSFKERGSLNQSDTQQNDLKCISNISMDHNNKLLSLPLPNVFQLVVDKATANHPLFQSTAEGMCSQCTQFSLCIKVSKEHTFPIILSTRFLLWIVKPSTTMQITRLTNKRKLELMEVIERCQSSTKNCTIHTKCLK